MGSQNMDLYFLLNSLENKLNSLVKGARGSDSSQTPDCTFSAYEWKSSGSGEDHESLPAIPVESEPPTKNRRRKMARATRKRFRKLLQTNMSVVEALEVCKKTMQDIPILTESIPKAVKRNKSESVYSPVQAKVCKPSAMSTVNPIHEMFIDGPSRVGICNVSPMNKDQMDLVHHALTQEILKIDVKGAGPKFLGLSRKMGWMVITCMDNWSRHWLMETAHKLKPWPQARLTVKDESEFPKPATGSTFLPDSEVATVEQALEMIRVQNSNLNPELWKILHSKEKNHGLFVIFALDDPSVQAIRENKNKVNLGLKMINFKIRNGRKAKNMVDILGAPVINLEDYEVSRDTFVTQPMISVRAPLYYGVTDPDSSLSNHEWEKRLVSQAPRHFYPGSAFWERRT